jgi:hypothetical protein
MMIGWPPALLTLPRNAPESKSKALTEPSPKLPTNRALSKLPKPSKGAQAIPQGELSSPLLMNRRSRFPSVSKMSTNPFPGPATSSRLAASCLA